MPIDLSRNRLQEFRSNDPARFAALQRQALSTDQAVADKAISELGQAANVPAAEVLALVKLIDGASNYGGPSTAAAADLQPATSAGASGSLTSRYGGSDLQQWQPAAPGTAATAVDSPSQPATPVQPSLTLSEIKSRKAELFLNAVNVMGIEDLFGYLKSLDIKEAAFFYTLPGSLSSSNVDEAFGTMLLDLSGCARKFDLPYGAVSDDDKEGLLLDTGLWIGSPSADAYNKWLDSFPCDGLFGLDTGCAKIDLTGAEPRVTLRVAL